MNYEVPNAIQRYFSKTNQKHPFINWWYYEKVSCLVLHTCSSCYQYTTEKLGINNDFASFEGFATIRGNKNHETEETKLFPMHIWDCSCESKVTNIATCRIIFFQSHFEISQGQKMTFHWPCPFIIISSLYFQWKELCCVLVDWRQTPVCWSRTVLFAPVIRILYTCVASFLKVILYSICISLFTTPIVPQVWSLPGEIKLDLRVARFSFHNCFTFVHTSCVTNSVCL